MCESVCVCVVLIKKIFIKMIFSIQFIKCSIKSYLNLHQLFYSVYFIRFQVSELSKFMFYIKITGVFRECKGPILHWCMSKIIAEKILRNACNVKGNVII